MDVAGQYPLEIAVSDRELFDGLFELLFKENYVRLVDAVTRIVGERSRAEELTNETFWRLHTQPPPEDRRENLPGWLFRTATRLGIDALRAENRRLRNERAAASPSERSLSASPLDRVIQEEQKRQVRAALGRMKPERAQLLLLRNAAFSYKELAETFAVQTSSVGTLLARAEAEFEALYRNMFGKEDSK